MREESVLSKSVEETENLGERIGRNLHGGEIIELISDLGGGKTALTRGIARGAGSSAVVGSPTFTLSKVYNCPNFTIRHFDFYRLSEVGIMEHELAEFAGDPSVVLIIEWGDIAAHILPENRWTVKIAKTPEGNRSISIKSSINLKEMSK